MEFPYAEFKDSTHYKSRSGVSPLCVNCHIDPDSGLLGKLKQVRKDKRAGSSVSSEDEWSEIRPRLAKVVRDKLLKNDSATCRSCHVRIAIVSESATIMRAHKKMETQNKTCIDCHYNLVHAEVPWGDEDEEEDDEDDE